MTFASRSRQLRESRFELLFFNLTLALSWFVPAEECFNLAV